MSRKYINQITRRLKCSKKKREEIKKQLLSEFEAELGSGATQQDIVERMGKPIEIAAEFNQNFSETEQKKYKKEKWMKRIGIILGILIIVIGIVLWILPKQIWIEDSKVFEKGIVLQQAELVVEYLDAEDYEALKAISDKKMASILEGDGLTEAKAQIGTDWGKRQSIGNTYAVEVTQMGVKNAIVQMHVLYENETVLYTIFFNLEMELTGLWMQ